MFIKPFVETQASIADTKYNSQVCVIHQMNRPILFRHSVHVGPRSWLVDRRSLDGTRTSITVEMTDFQTAWIETRARNT